MVVVVGVSDWVVDAGVDVVDGGYVHAGDDAPDDEDDDAHDAIDDESK